MLEKIPPVLKNKYLLTLILFVVWMSFFDRHNLINQISAMQKLEQLKADKEYYINEIEKNKADVHDLMTNSESLEKFAREKYLMKKENEEIFVIVTEDEK